MEVSIRGLPANDAGDETTKIETLFGISQRRVRDTHLGVNHVSAWYITNSYILRVVLVIIMEFHWLIGRVL